MRDHRLLRTETTSSQTTDRGVRKDVVHLPELRAKMAARKARYLEVQQDVLETFVDRGQREWLRPPTVTARGRRTPGLKLDDPRLLAVLQALTCFAYLAGSGCFRTADLHQDTAEALGRTTDTYTLAQLRYDLAKLRAKGLVERLPGTQTYRLLPEGYRRAVLYVKLFHKIYAPLTAGTLAPVAADERLLPERRARLDRLYVAVDRALHPLCEQVGIQRAG